MSTLYSSGAPLELRALDPDSLQRLGYTSQEPPSVNLSPEKAQELGRLMEEHKRYLSEHPPHKTASLLQPWFSPEPLAETTLPSGEETLNLDPNSRVDTSFLKVTGLGKKGSLIKMFLSLQRSNVVSRLPKAVLVGVLIDFFVVNAGMDTYKSEITEDPGRATVIFMQEALVRAAVFTLITFVTIQVFS